MKSLNVWNEEIFHDVKVLGEYTTTAAMKEDIQRDMDHLYALLDQRTHEDILQQLRKNIRTVLNLAEVNIIEASSRSLRVYPMNQQTKHYFHKTTLLNVKTL